MITERNYNAWIYILNCTLEFIIFTTCILLIINGTGSFAFFMAMTYYVYRFMNTIELMMNLSTSIQKMKVSIERLSEILDNKLYKDEKFGIVSKTDILGNIEFKNVTFKYPNEEKEIFIEGSGLNKQLRNINGLNNYVLTVNCENYQILT